jgi:hypothetical protein
VVVVSGLDGECNIRGDWLWHVHVLREPVVLETRTSPEEGAVSDFVDHLFVFLRIYS